MPKVLIAGGGLVGALNACFFANRGWDVEVFDIRMDIRKMEHVPGRSINLALSQRGKASLDAVGLKDYIANSGVKMFSRLVHDIDGKTFHRQPYGQPGEHIVSINRRHLNEIMITEAEKFNKVKFYFEHKVIKADCKKKELHVIDLNTDQLYKIKGDLIIACDGAHSAVRRSLMALPHFNYSQEYIEHGYVELNILPKNDDYALEPNVFHLWPRGDFTLIALANRDKTFTVTIFAPFKIFKKYMYDDKSVLNFFQKYFPDAYKLLGDSHIIETFNRMKPQTLLNIKCSPHSFGDCILLTGDAAHAMVPFYGQGMNCGFEDCLVFSKILDEFKDDIPKALAAYSERRVKDCHTINNLAMYNYNELKDLVNRMGYKIRKNFDLKMNKYFPNFWIPLYSMVTFTQIPYSKVVEKREWQNNIISKTQNIISLLSIITIGAIIINKKEIIKNIFTKS
ncbi:Kynurenine 3-monooxygenase [Strongyloides ratti]|uniref:Kynurenine 3-monooxygenase n=1 Tax=Strongyloides ratti TaxID=34506 RepID=A0A090MZE7_STRRB|nr:Kynurenine 3-monooxygenase [Strongyloides ratti]CEF68804.1 Kynurenine 3-monooxygenase [Strongyloides ratti]